MGESGHLTLAAELIEVEDVWPAMPDKKKQAERSGQRSREAEDNQDAFRRSIVETDRLVGESEQMLRRHRREREEDDEG
jgi:hypothetical protein